MNQENKYKLLPFRLSTGYGGACSLTTFANLFNNDYFLNPSALELANRKEILLGLFFSEEVLELASFDVLLEPAILIPTGVPTIKLLDLFDDAPDKDEVYVYLVRSIKGDLTVKDSEAKGHRFLILQTKRQELLIVDSYYDYSYKIDFINHLNTAKPLNQHDKIVGIDILYNSDRTRKVFKRDELSHLL